MIWCFGFFFLELLDDFDEGSQQRREALANWTMLTENCAAFRHSLLKLLVSGLESQRIITIKAIWFILQGDELSESKEES